MRLNQTSPNSVAPNVIGTESFLVKLALASLADSGAVVASIANPFGESVIIEQAILDITTVATGASTLDIGPAADEETASDTLFDGLNANAATGSFSSHVSGGTNGLGSRKWTSSQYVTVKDASGSPVGLVGALYLICRRLA